MANRILRDWTQSENVDMLDEKAEVFFVRLIMKADDYGCYYGNSKLLKSHLYPLKNIWEEEIENFISQCEQAKLIIVYEIENKKYLKINNFGQRLRTMNSKFPQPADICQPYADNGRLETKGSRNEVEEEKNINNNENFKNSLLTQELWQDQMCIKHKLKTREAVKKFLNDFVIHQSTIDSVSKNEKEFKNHFNNWLYKQEKPKDQEVKKLGYAIPTNK